MKVISDFYYYQALPQPSHAYLSSDRIYMKVFKFLGGLVHSGEFGK